QLELSERPRDGLAHRLRHARLRAHASLDPPPEPANGPGARCRPVDHRHRVQSTVPRRALFQRCGGWVCRWGAVAVGVYLRPRGCTRVACGIAAGRSVQGALVPGTKVQCDTAMRSPGTTAFRVARVPPGWITYWTSGCTVSQEPSCARKVSSTLVSPAAVPPAAVCARS